MRVFEIGEFGLIEKIAALIKNKSNRNADSWKSLLIGVGDDTAAWKSSERIELITTDILVEGTHFRLSYTGWYDLGWKSVAINVSDIYAMGGKPQHALVSLAMPGLREVANVLEMYEGMIDMCNKYGIAIAGGNISSAENVVINIVLTGVAENNLMTRSSAKAGDLIAVFGYPGLSAAGLKAIKDPLNMDADSLKLFKQAHLHPEPRLDSGAMLAACGVKTAIDISDGLHSDLGHICEASSVSAVVNSQALPAHPQLKRQFPKEYIDMILTGGEDYELLFTAPRRVMDKVIKAIHPAPTIIGEITSGKRGDIVILDDSGILIIVDSRGWDHYKRAPSNG
ncbi:MAG: thiamine-phosphate kinase [Dehalococcoidia bacterium]|nr:thiamine-phosphate kinase [Dehalococcoidia bacterium]